MRTTPGTPSLLTFLRRWWNWLRLPRFKSDDEICTCSKHAWNPACPIHGKAAA